MNEQIKTHKYQEGYLKKAQYLLDFVDCQKWDGTAPSKGIALRAQTLLMVSHLLETRGKIAESRVYLDRCFAFLSESRQYNQSESHCTDLIDSFFLQIKVKNAWLAIKQSQWDAALRQVPEIAEHSASIDSEEDLNSLQTQIKISGIKFLVDVWLALQDEVKATNELRQEDWSIKSALLCRRLARYLDTLISRVRGNGTIPSNLCSPQDLPLFKLLGLPISAYLILQCSRLQLLSRIKEYQDRLKITALQVNSAYSMLCLVPHMMTLQRSSWREMWNACPNEIHIDKAVDLFNTVLQEIDMLAVSVSELTQPQDIFAVRYISSLCSIFRSSYPAIFSSLNYLEYLGPASLECAVMLLQWPVTRASSLQSQQLHFPFNSISANQRRQICNDVEELVDTDDSTTLQEANHSENFVGL